jgi:hypothetical protein
MGRTTAWRDKLSVGHALLGSCFLRVSYFSTDNGWGCRFRLDKIPNLNSQLWSSCCTRAREHLANYHRGSNLTELKEIVPLTNLRTCCSRCGCPLVCGHGGCKVHRRSVRGLALLQLEGSLAAYSMHNNLGVADSMCRRDQPVRIVSR